MRIQVRWHQPPLRSISAALFLLTTFNYSHNRPSDGKETMVSQQWKKRHRTEHHVWGGRRVGTFKCGAFALCLWSCITAA